MSSDKLSDKEIFKVARRLDSPDEISEYLAKQCGDNTQQKERILRLLESDLSDGFLERPPLPMPGTEEFCPYPQSEDQVIGNYKLLEKIGEGGMGVVYLAEQKKPVVRRVAIKIVQPGLGSRDVIARFEAERQAISMMEHPNIAKMLDAGTTDRGLPYFVMEYVHGSPITKFCEEEQLSIDDRLKLFISVCHAVEHAHQKGVIHRDIKPSNVLATKHDDKPTSKVIDFGLAKATGYRLTEKSLHTRLNQVLGTPEYMSPEQASPKQDVDTRSDIYSLGVLLYELLTGQRPINRKDLIHADLGEVIRLIRDHEPIKPSDQIRSSFSRSGVSTKSFAATDSRKLTSQVKGDLDWIVMKAIDKDRTRRYPTLRELTHDLQRHLSNEPVSAGPPSFSYKAHKFARRNRGLLTSLAVIAASLMVGLTLFVAEYRQKTRYAVEASRQRDMAIKNGETAEKTLELFLNAIGTAEWFGQKIERGRNVTFKGPDYTVAQVIGDLSHELESDKSIDPEVAFRTQHAIAVFYVSAGDREKAAFHFMKAAKISEQLNGFAEDRALVLRLAGQQMRWVDPKRAEDFHLQSKEVYDKAGLEVPLGLGRDIAIAQYEQGKKESAKKQFLAILQQWKAIDPFAKDYAWGLITKSLWHHEDKEYHDAYESRKKGISILERHKHGVPLEQYAHLSKAARLSGQLKESFQALRKCESIIDHGSTDEAWTILGELNALKGAAIEEGDFALAFDSLLAALDLDTKRHSQNRNAKLFLSQRYFSQLAEVALSAARTKDENRMRMLRDLPGRMRDFLSKNPGYRSYLVPYDLARIESRLAEMHSVDVSVDYSLPNELIDSSIQHLERAIASGLRDLSLLMLDSDLRFLRMQRQFRESLADRLGLLGTQVRVAVPDSLSSQIVKNTNSKPKITLVYRLSDDSKDAAEQLELISHLETLFGSQELFCVVTGGQVAPDHDVTNQSSRHRISTKSIEEIIIAPKSEPLDLSSVFSLLIDSDGLIIGSNFTSPEVLGNLLTRCIGSYTDLAFEAVVEGDLSRAIGVLSAAVEIDSSNLALWHTLSICLTKNNQLSELPSVHRRAQESLGPNADAGRFTSLVRMCGTAAVTDEPYERLLEKMQVVRKRYGGKDQWQAEGLILYRMGRLEESLDCFGKSGNVISKYFAAMAFARLGKKREAQESLRLAIEKQSNGVAKLAPGKPLSSDLDPWAYQLFFEQVLIEVERVLRECDIDPMTSEKR